ncbi:hypothetical protein [Gordonia sp. SL306]|uniref:hypothetical protein n=1 Tax=Gordonia sp. SL306 TaxID=2995145 RepID=UPI00226D6F4A|nr:hypothetical protein [Gordonia sp. SL306]WAC55162.1 hypothetical protein OVA31_21465 [Gordonia sp. SL306]
MTTPVPTPASGPELLEVPVAVWAFGVSLLSFVIALAALGWQIAKHFLDGGRVKVFLNTAIWEPEVSLYTITNGKFGFPDDDTARSATDGKGLELAQLVVENPGRVPVTVHSPGIYITGHGKKNHSISPRSFSTGDSFGHDRSTTERTVRLEPYARTTFLLDYWSIVPNLFGDTSVDHIVLRGQVGVAGRSNRPQRSKWRRRWTIARGSYTAIGGPPSFTPFAVLWRELYVQLPERDDPDRHPQSGPATTRGMAGFILDQAMSRFDERPEREELQHAVEEIAKERGDRFPIVGIGLYHGYEALGRLEGHLKPWTDGLMFRAIANHRDVSEELRRMDAVQAARATAIAADNLSVIDADVIPRDQSDGAESGAEQDRRSDQEKTGSSRTVLNTPDDSSEMPEHTAEDEEFERD